MKYCFEVRTIPEGEPRPNTSVTMRRVIDGITITAGTTDANGLICFSTDGHYSPFYVHVTGVPGGDKFWRSDESHGAGAISLSEVPHALHAMGDGVIRGYADELLPFLNGLVVSVATGAALCAGYPVVNYALDIFTLTRPVSSTRVDRVVARVYPFLGGSNSGRAEFVILAGTEGAGAPALTQSSAVYEVSLATITVPTAGALTMVDDRAFVGEQLSDQDVVRLASITTTNASGEYLTGLTTTLDLASSATYDIAASLSCIQNVNTGWALQATYSSWTYDPGGGGIIEDYLLSNPGQVAVGPTGKIYIANTGYNYLLILNSDGTYSGKITGLTGITGVCVDSSDTVYVAYNPGAGVAGIKKYSSLLALQWTELYGSGTTVKHIAVDGTHYYACDSGNNRIIKGLLSTGALVTYLGSAGSGNGQLNTPYGIDFDGTHLWVVDPGNTRVQKLTTAGVYVSQFSTSGAAGAGIDHDSAGRLLICLPTVGPGIVVRYTTAGVEVDSFLTSGGTGIAVATGDILWVGNATDDTIAKWDEGDGGYGAVAIEIDSVVSDYVGIGNRDGSVANSAVGTKAGPGTVLIRAFGTATTATAVFESCVLSAKATPRR